MKCRQRTHRWLRCCRTFYEGSGVRINLDRPAVYPAIGIQMTYEEFNEYCGSLPATNYVVQWGDSHVWKVGEKVFAIGGWQKSAVPAYTFKVSEIAYEVLRDMPGLRPAPYFASRGMKWIQQYAAPGLSDADLENHLSTSHQLASLKLTKRRQKELGLNGNSNSGQQP